MKTSLFFSILVSSILLLSCDIIEGDPYVRNNNNSDPVELDTVKRVLLLEFTGQKCPNCPEGHEQIQQLKNFYGSRFIPVAIHAGYYAIPSSTYPIDYRTTFGTNFHNLFNPTSYPIGMVDALKHENLQTHGFWSEKVAEQMNRTSHLAINFESQIAVNQLNISVEVRSRHAVLPEESYRLYTLLIEDSIVGRQANGATSIADYVHDHVVRHGFTSHLGDSISLFNPQQRRKVSYQTSINEQWRIQHLSVVAFVVNSNDEVVQSGTKKLSTSN